MMKVALFFSHGVSLLDWKNNGSIDRELIIYRELSKLGYKFYFITYGDDRDTKIITDKNIEIIPIFRSKDKNKIFRIFKIIIFPIILRKKFKKVDLLKTNQLTGSLLAILIKFFFNKPLIVRLGYEPLQQLKLLKKYSNFTNFLLKLLFKFFYSYSTLISTSSNEIKNYIIKEYKINENKIYYNWNFVDTEIFQPLNVIKNNRLLYIGRLTDVKNIYLLLKSIKDTNFGLDIIGDGYLKNQINIYIKKQKLDVKILPRCNNRDLPKLINQYTLYILCSKIEGNPKTLLEVMSCGIPVIGTNVPGIKEIVINNHNGLLTSENEIDLRNNIIKLYKNKNKQNTLATNARNLILKHCSIKSYLDFEISVINKLL